MTLFYREKSVVEDELPLDDIKFSAGDRQSSWEQPLQTANNFLYNGQTPTILSITRTPKNIGNARNQTIWYTASPGSPSTFCTTLSRGDADWEKLATDVQEWLNTYIAPHQLVSISFHE